MKAVGIKGPIIFTVLKVAPLSGVTTGRGVLFTGRYMVAIKSFGFGNDGGKSKPSNSTFATTSQRLSWVNDMMAVIT